MRKASATCDKVFAANPESGGCLTMYSLYGAEAEIFKGASSKKNIGLFRCPIFSGDAHGNEPCDSALRSDRSRCRTPRGLGAVVEPTPAPEAGAKAYALPAELLRAAKRWKVDLKDVTIAVLPVDDVRRTEKDSNVTRVRPVLLHRADVSVAPASSAKVVTTLVALETLGSHYRWYTGFYADEKAEPDAKGVLRSPLYIKGGGDPNFVLEAFDLELTRLAKRASAASKGTSWSIGPSSTFPKRTATPSTDGARAPTTCRPTPRSSTTAT